MGFGEKAFGTNISVFTRNKRQMVGVHYYGDNKGDEMTKSSVPVA